MIEKNSNRNRNKNKNMKMSLNNLNKNNNHQHHYVHSYSNNDKHQQLQINYYQNSTKIYCPAKKTIIRNSSCMNYNNNEKISNAQHLTPLLRFQINKKMYQKINGHDDGDFAGDDEHLGNFESIIRQQQHQYRDGTCLSQVMAMKCNFIPSSFSSSLSSLLRLIGLIWTVSLGLTILLNNITAVYASIKVNQEEQLPFYDDGTSGITVDHHLHHHVPSSSSKILLVATSPMAMLNKKSRNTRDIRLKQLSALSSPMQIRLRRPIIISRQQHSEPELSRTVVSYSRLSKLIKNRLHLLALSLNEKLRPQTRSSHDDSRSREEQMSATTAASQHYSYGNEYYRNNNNDTNINKSTRRNDDILSDTILTDNTDPPYLSPTLNVIDDGPNNTKIAHNILIVHKNSKLNKSETNRLNHSEESKPNYFSSLYDSALDLKFQNPTQSYSKPSFVTKKTSLLDDLEFVPIKNNHRPSNLMSFSKWKQKNKISTTTKLIVSVTPSPLKKNSILPTKSSWHDRIDLSSLSSSSTVPRTSPFITTTHSPVTNKLQDQNDSFVQQQSTNKNKLANQSTNRPSHLPSTYTMVMALDNKQNEITKMTTHFVTNWTTTTNTMMTTTNKTTESDFPDSQLQSSTIKNIVTPEETSWSELMTSNPIDSLTITEDPTWGNIATTADDNSIEMLKEFNEELHSSRKAPAVMTSTQSSLINGSKVGFYNKNDNADANNKQEPTYYEDSIIVFKNNHIRPKKPVTYQPSTLGYKAKPPYATIFNYSTTTVPTRRTSISFANVVGHRVKQPEEIKSATLTVLDPPYQPNSLMQLPLNTTIVHKNILVPMKEGRPKPKFPSRPTTLFPVYPVVAGVSNWQSQTTTWLMPAITTSPPEKIEEIISSASNTNFTFVQEDQFNLFTTTTAPSLASNKIITKKISKLPSVYTYRPKISTTTTMSPLSSLSTRRPSMFHAINAPPMPIFRPSNSIAPPNRLFSNWMSRFRKFWTSVIPNNTGSVSLMSLIRSTVYSLMVMLLPPLALMTFFTT